MWLIVGAMCTAAACVWYPVDGAQHRTEQACMRAISTLHDTPRRVRTLCGSKVPTRASPAGMIVACFAWMSARQMCDAAIDFAFYPRTDCHGSDRRSRIVSRESVES